MKQLLRSVVDFDGKITQENLVLNLQRLHSSRYEMQRSDDQTIYRFVLDYFQARMEVPQFATIGDYFERLKDTEAIERLKDIAGTPAYIRTNFKYLLDTQLEEQNRVKAIGILKETQEIITKGLEIEGERKVGVRDGFQHFAGKANELIIPDYNARIRGDVRLDGQEVWNEYETAKLNKEKAFGRFTGLTNIDTICHGIKKGELWVHAAFPGELKCLSGDTTIFDHRANRRRTLAELYATGELPLVTALDHEGATHKLVISETSHLMQNGVRDVYDIVLSSGRHIGATENHKFFTPKGWQRLDELSVGDWVAVPSVVKTVSTARILTDAEVKVIGYLLGDGGLTDGIRFTAKNDVIREDFKSCLVDMGLVEGPADYITPTFCEVVSEERATSVRVSSSRGEGNSAMRSPVRDLLEGLGLYGLGSYDKHLPDVLFGLPEDQVALLIGALWSTDGSCHTGDHVRADRESLCRRNDISYASVSHQLCLDVQSMLLRIGVQSSVTRVDTTYEGEPYTFFTIRVVTNPSKRAFVEHVKVIGKENQFSLLADRLPTTDDRPFPSSFIPDGMKVPWVGAAKWRYASAMKGRPSVRADTLHMFATDEGVKRALDGDLTWSQVSSITLRGKEMTYDLSVPQHHSFVANDIVTHNTTFAMNWCYNLVTRYRSNIFYCSMEMPYTQLRKQAYVLHSANRRWGSRNGAKPLDYRKVRDGQLDENEEAFYQEVIQDFHGNPEYTSFEVWAPDREVNVDDIRLEAELLHKQSELGLIVLDHGMLIEARKKKRSKDYVVELNSVIRDAKKLALHFNHGEGIPVLMLFQINRTGKDEADKSEGRYKMKALTYANECEKSADIITTTYLNDDHRRNGTTVFCNLKNRDNPQFEPFTAKVNFSARRIYNMDSFDGAGMGIEDHQSVQSALDAVQML